LRHADAALFGALPRQPAHGDIGLDNVLLDGERVVAVIDFTPYARPVLLTSAPRCTGITRTGGGKRGAQAGGRPGPQPREGCTVTWATNWVGWSVSACWRKNAPTAIAASGTPAPTADRGRSSRLRQKLSGQSEDAASTA